MLIAIAITEWLAFAVTLVLYRVGNQINAAENLALEAHSLALMLDDDFLDMARRGIKDSLNSNPEWLNLPPEQLAFITMQGILTVAKRGWNARGPGFKTVDDPLDLLAIVTQALKASTT